MILLKKSFPKDGIKLFNRVLKFNFIIFWRNSSNSFCSFIFCLLINLSKESFIAIIFALILEKSSFFHFFSSKLKFSPFVFWIRALILLLLVCKELSISFLIASLKS